MLGHLDRNVTCKCPFYNVFLSEQYHRNVFAVRVALNGKRAVTAAGIYRPDSMHDKRVEALTTVCFPARANDSAPKRRPSPPLRAIAVRGPGALVRRSVLSQLRLASVPLRGRGGGLPLRASLCRRPRCLSRSACLRVPYRQRRTCGWRTSVLHLAVSRHPSPFGMHVLERCVCN